MNAPAPSTLPLGWSPVVPITLTIRGARRVVFLKLEGAVPGRSVKDRTARSLLASLDQRGLLTPRSTIVESTSGNLGVALARLARARGLRFLAVVDPKTTRENLAGLQRLGARVEMVREPDATGGFLLARLARVRALCAASPDFVWTDQYANPANPRAHARTTAPELYAQLGGRVDAIIVPVSTGGTLAGVGAYFRATSPATRLVGVDARGSVVFGGTPGPRLLTGIGSSQPSAFLTPAAYDESRQVADAPAFAFARALRDATGLSVGGSSGAALAACAAYLGDHPEVERAVCLCADGGDNYASSVFDDAWLANHGVRLSPADLEPVQRIEPGPACATWEPFRACEWRPAMEVAA